MDEWRELLRQSRETLRLSRTQLASIANLSPATIKSYEQGPRHPKRPYLVAVLDALKVERGARNSILASAGFVPDGLSLVPGEPRGTFTRDEAAAVVRAARWPAFLLDEWATVIEANEAVQRLWGIDLTTEFADPVERNLLSVASNPRFAARLLNWPEAIGTIVSVFKQKEWGKPEQLESPSPAFAAALQRFLAGDPKYVNQLSEIWERTPSTPWDHKIRWTYPVMWEDPDVGLIRFEALVTVASHAESINFNDWIPLGSESWAALERLSS